MGVSFFERLTSKMNEGERLRAFAERIGVPYPTMRNWAKGMRPEQADLYVKLADKLGVTASWLAFGKEAEQPDGLPERVAE